MHTQQYILMHVHVYYEENLYLIVTCSSACIGVRIECVTGVHLFCLLHVFSVHAGILLAHMGWLSEVWTCIGVCVCLGVKGTTTGHGLSQTGWARNVLTSPHTLPEQSYSSSFFCLYQARTHSQTHTHSHMVCMHLARTINLLFGCGGIPPYIA